MKSLRTLTLFHCRNSLHFIHALNPGLDPSGVVICHNLEELVFILRADEEPDDIGSMVRMAAWRASREVKLKSVRILPCGEGGIDVSELEEYTSHLECGPGVSVADGDGGTGLGDYWGGFLFPGEWVYVCTLDVDSQLSGFYHKSDPSNPRIYYDLLS